MAKELILLEDIADLGRIGDVVRVADGYARNYLLPRKLAEVVNAGVLRKVEARKLRMQKEREERVSVARAMADRIAAEALVFPVAVGENEKMYGSVGSQMIVDGLKAKGIEIDKNIVVLPEPIRAVGEYSVEIKLHPEVTASVNVFVVKE